MPRTAPPSRIGEPVHVILGMSAAGSLRQAGGRVFVILHDHLCPGPCDLDPGPPGAKGELVDRGRECVSQGSRVCASLLMLGRALSVWVDGADWEAWSATDLGRGRLRPIVKLDRWGRVDGSVASVTTGVHRHG